MWNGIKIPQKNDGTALFWSILTVEDGREMPDGRWFHGKLRHWVEASQEGLSRVQKMAENSQFKAVYFSQGLYWKPGKIAGKAGIACLPWCWVDLDCHNHVEGWSSMSFDEQASFVAGECMGAGLPLPSQIISSGRGAYAVWKLTEPLWNVSKRKSARKPASVIEALNSQIQRKLAHIGADARCTEYGRILRVPGSRNWGAYGAIVQTIWDSGMTYSVGDLKASLMPWTPEEVRQYKASKKARLSARKRRSAPVVDIVAERDKRTAGFTQRKHAHRIIEDLRTLADLRWSGRVDEGFRDMFGHLIVSAVARYHKNSSTLLAEARKYADDLIDDEDFESHNSTSVKLLEAGKGYAYSIQTMRKLLKVTPYESPRLFVLSSEEEKAARQVKSKEAKRRAKGVLDRASYDAKRSSESLKATRPWEALGVSRATYYRQIKAHEATQPNRKRA
ncbi:hypothetical protein D3W54_16130 (plasmid) [Komagataeibacter medellinensis]|uniref:Replication protein n=2 Tax=Komagataeibacter medellinensis TaxID=1177712 RepID=A0ABQ6VQK7_9PROT|nr:hypothetical protein D3W54_16130 [Komagataeibacter medellinensis]